MITKKLFTGGINQDDGYMLVAKEEYLNGLNIRFTSSEHGKVGEVSNIEGNVAITITLPSGVNICIGAYEDTPNRRLFFFNQNSNSSHGIYCYDADDGNAYTVLLSSQVVGGLGFGPFIHSVAMVGNLLYFTDGQNPQRRINVEAGIKLNHPAYNTAVAPYVLDTVESGQNKMLSSVISLIRNQPWAPPSIEKIADAGYPNNFIKEEAFQFMYRFVYRDNEVSTFSPLSVTANYNTSTDNTNGINAIQVTIPTLSKITQDVKYVEVAVRYVLGGNVFVIKTFDSGFDTHNNGVTALSFKFYNDSVGVAVDNATSVKQFDSIPVRSKTLEVVKNRLFLGNNVDGYDTPTSTSLTLSSAVAGSSQVSGQWYKIIYRADGVTLTKYYVYLFDVAHPAEPGYYEPATQPNPSAFPTSASFASLNLVGANINAIAAYLGIQPQDIFQLYYVDADITITGITSSSLANTPIFKTDSSYRAGVVFFDEAGRKSGVVTNANAVRAIPDRAYDTVSFVREINWSLDNLQFSEIPTWATHYAVVRTKCLRTSFFQQLRSPTKLKYISKNAETGEYDPPSDTHTPGAFGVAIDISGLFSVGLGYQYQEGDLVKLYVSGVVAPYTLAVKDQTGSYVIADLINLDSTSKDILFEIYTPYVRSDVEPYFEVGQVYKINNPGLNTRRYSVVTGSFRGDTYLLSRGAYLTEVMSPNDKLWKNWNTDIGRVSSVVRAGQESLPTGVSYSNQIIQGTEINGLSTFDALDTNNLPIEMKQIQRLILSTKVNAEGNVLLAIGEQETASVYIGEAQILDSSGEAFLATTTGIIGTINILRGSYGTINPESVFKWKGEVMFFDANAGSWVRYNVNGLFPYSSYKMTKYFKKCGQDIMKYLQNPSEYNLANPNLPIRVLGGADPFHEEYLSSMPRMYLEPKNLVLEDMPLSSWNYPFTTAAAAMSVTPSSTPFTYQQGSGPSTSQQFTFSGTNLSINGTVTITAPSAFEVSKDNITFGNSITFTYLNTSATGNFRVRMKAGILAGSVAAANVTVVGGGASANLSVSGTVSVSVTPSITPSRLSIGGFSYTEGSGPSAPAELFTISVSSLSPSSGNITIIPPTDYEISTVGPGPGGFTTSSAVIAYTGGNTLASNQVWVRLRAGKPEGNYSLQEISISGGGASATVTVSGQVLPVGGTPTIYWYPGSGYGLSVSESCSMATGFPITLYSYNDPLTFGPASIVFINRTTSPTRLLGYTHIFMNGRNWDINPADGSVIGESADQC
jgi:hypothetical protein